MKRTIFFVFAMLLLAVISCKKDKASLTVKDADGNIYHTVKIGKQVWMVENLKTTKYNDGSSIPNITDAAQWKGLSSGAYCNIGDNEVTANTYGRLYNWYAVQTGKLAPTGWHVATNEEWAILIEVLGGDAIAANKLKEGGTEHWDNTDAGVDNSSGFTALGTGFRGLNNSNIITYQYFGLASGFWSSDVDNVELAWLRYLGAFEPNVYNLNKPKYYGYSVRCVKD